MKKLFIFTLLVCISVFTYAQMMPYKGEALPYSGQRTPSGQVLYSQMTPNGAGNANQYFPDFGGCVIQFVDDFVVPSSPGWTINDIEVFGFYYAANPNLGPAIDFIVEIFPDAGGAPAPIPMQTMLNVPYTVTGTPGFLQLFELNLPAPLILGPGTYWISIMPNMAFSPTGQYAWAFDTPQVGAEAFVQDPCGLIGWPPTFTPASVMQGTPYDMCFAFYGTPPVPVSNWAIIFGVLLIGAFIVVRYRRRILA